MGSITRGIANNILGNGAVDGTDALSGTIPANNIANASLSNLTAFPPSVSAGIPQVASDPPSPTVGDVWYNTTSYKLKVRGYSVPAGSWASGGSMNTARAGVEDGSAGSQTASIVMGGITPGGNTTATETYNGSTWTTVPGTLNTARQEGGAVGTTSDALFFAGRNPAPVGVGNTESYNGTTWTEVNDTNVATFRIGSAGTPSAALRVGGGPPYQATTESFDGTSWTEVNDLNTARCITGVGLQTAALMISGEVPGAPYRSANVESWNGSAWTEVADLNVLGNFNGNFGSQTLALDFGGNDPSTRVTTTEAWDGTSWTEVADLSTARSELGGAGIASLGITMGGYAGTPGGITNTEEWTAPTGNLNVTLT